MANAGDIDSQPTFRLRRLVLHRPLWPHLFMALFGAGWAVSFDVVAIVGKASLTLSDIENAFDYYKLLTKLKDSILNKETNFKISELEVKFETKEKEIPDKD